MIPLADDTPSADHDGTDRRVRAGASKGPRRERERATHIRFFRHRRWIMGERRSAVNAKSAQPTP
jgi:hypothetical protein